MDVVEVSAEGGRLDCDFGPICRVVDLPIGQSTRYFCVDALFGDELEVATSLEEIIK